MVGFDWSMLRTEPGRVGVLHQSARGFCTHREPGRRGRCKPAGFPAVILRDSTMRRAGRCGKLWAMSELASDSGAAVDVILRDGATLRLRAPTPADEAALAGFFAGLSERSR